MSLCVSVFSRERHNVQMLRASLSETSGLDVILDCKETHTKDKLARVV